MSVKDGRIVLPDGMSYRVLVLPQVETMTPALLQKIQQLVAAGATVVAPSRPLKSPSLADYPRCDEEVQKLVEALWTSGKLVTDKPVEKVLAALGVPEDFRSDRPLRYIHRQIDDADVYFIANGAEQDFDATCLFRMTGKRPQLWHPETGRMTPLSVYEAKDGCTRVPLHFGPTESVFVVFWPGVDDPSQRIVSVTRDGQELLRTNAVPTTQASNAIAGTFTMAVWVKPDADTALPPETDHGVTYLNAARNDVLYPPPGHEVWTDADAGAGIAVGRNGVCVTEHGANHFPATLVHAATLTDWTHIAIVYRDNRPSLYLNGKLVRAGLKSPFVVHPGVGVVHGRATNAFGGQIAGLQQFDRALDDAEIAKLAQSARPAVTSPDMPAIDLVAREILAQRCV